MELFRKIRSKYFYKLFSEINIWKTYFIYIKRCEKISLVHFNLRLEDYFDNHLLQIQRNYRKIIPLQCCLWEKEQKWRWKDSHCKQETSSNGQLPEAITKIFSENQLRHSTVPTTVKLKERQKKGRWEAAKFKHLHMYNICNIDVDLPHKIVGLVSIPAFLAVYIVVMYIIFIVVVTATVTEARFICIAMLLCTFAWCFCFECNFYFRAFGMQQRTYFSFC